MNNQNASNLSNKAFFSSWSGGKDSCLALYRAIKMGGKPKTLFTMFTETHERSRSHGLGINILQKQAQLLGIPLVTRSATWGEYEAVFIEEVKQLKVQGIEAGVFGDIDLEEHREWEEKVCSAAGIEPALPLWQEERTKLVYEFIEAGFNAIIIALKDGVLDKEFLGKPLSKSTVEELLRLGVDPSGEGGEFHTVVTDGPIFKAPMILTFGERYLIDGYWFLDVKL